MCASIVQRYAPGVLSTVLPGRLTCRLYTVSPPPEVAKILLGECEPPGVRGEGARHRRQKTAIEPREIFAFACDDNAYLAVRVETESRLVGTVRDANGRGSTCPQPSEGCEGPAADTARRTGERRRIGSRRVL